MMSRTKSTRGFSKLDRLKESWRYVQYLRDVPDVRVLPEAHQRMLRVVENALLDS